jgi:hypothetical protein
MFATEDAADSSFTFQQLTARMPAVADGGHCGGCTGCSGCANLL